jgi:hypothetical protein
LVIAEVRTSRAGLERSAPPSMLALIEAGLAR